ncbi:MAG: peroxide stress protein YaaA, partial [Gammaproteobacteria bacterium]
MRLLVGHLDHAARQAEIAHQLDQPLEVAQLVLALLAPGRPGDVDAALLGRALDALLARLADLRGQQGVVEAVVGTTARADRVYSGVLYEALDLTSLDAAARRRATSWLAVTSGLFGLLRPADRIPAYRLSGG